jgi:cytochrome P450
MSTTRTSITDAGLPSLGSGADGLEPWEYFEQVRALGDVVWDEGMNAWLVTSHELLKEMARNDGDEKIWGSSRADDVDLLPVSLEEWLGFVGYHSDRNLQILNGDVHDQQHRWWMKTFSGRTIRVLGDTLIRPVAHAQLDRLEGLDRADLWEEFATRVAPRVIATAMGLPWDDDAWIDRLLELHRRRIDLIGRRFAGDRGDPEADSQAIQEGFDAVNEAAELVRPFVEERKGSDGEDFISLVWRGGDDMFGPGFNTNDVVGTINVAFAGGSSTTAASTSAGIYMLMTQPGLEAKLRKDGDDAIAGFVEEILRLYGPTPYRLRKALEDAELGGHPIKKGEIVIGLAHAANRDPERFECPYQVDLERRSPRDHFSFGIPGPRSCPGQGLARMQLTTIFSVLLERMHDIQREPGTPEPRYTDFFLRKWRPLNATFSMQERKAQ